MGQAVGCRPGCDSCNTRSETTAEPIDAAPLKPVDKIQSSQAGAPVAAATGPEGAVPDAVPEAVLKKVAKGNASAWKPEQSQTLEFIQSILLFNRLPQEYHQKLADAFEAVDFHKGDIVINQGDDGKDLFIIREGTVNVLVSGTKVATLKQGDYVGENALLRNEPRNASIMCETEVNTLKMSREKFNELGLASKIQFVNRRVIRAKSKQKLETKPPAKKTAIERQQMVKAIRNNEAMSTVHALDDRKINAMIDVTWRERVSKGTCLITQDSLEADYFYMVQSGTFEVILTTKGEHGKPDSTKQIGLVSEGSSFGELALLYVAARAATVRALEPSVVFVLDRASFKKILESSADEEAQILVQHLDKVSIFDTLKMEEKLAIARNLQTIEFRQGENVLTQGEAGDTFYILISGEVEVVISGKVEAKLKGTPTKAEMFGELAILNNAPRAATIQVISKTCSALSMDKTSFDALVGPLEALKARGKDGTEKVAKKAVPSSKKKSTNKQKILKNDLQKIGLIGCGGFGAVNLVKHTTTQETYAMKSLSKGYVVQNDMQECVFTEKNIQYSCQSPFIVKLYETFNDPQYFYLLLELALGGELCATYYKKGFHGKEGHAKFYVAATLFAFDHLHGLKVIYRDLKPENLLLTTEGQMKLTDFGLAKVVVGKTSTFCGTPDYLAPEVISQSGHTCAVDWWALGILLFELMTGQPPFVSQSPMQTYAKINKGIEKVKFPFGFSEACKSLVVDLVQKNPAERLAMRKGKTKNIKTHTWYKKFDWSKMESQKLLPPYLPPVKDKSDMSNFEAREEDCPPVIDYVDDGSGWDKDFATST